MTAGPICFNTYYPCHFKNVLVQYPSNTALVKTKSMCYYDMIQPMDPDKSMCSYKCVFLDKQPDPDQE